LALSRRELIAAGASMLAAPAAPGGLKIAVFSKHLQFLAGERLAKAAAEMGFDGVDLTVRAGGHVEPARVAQDLPHLIAVIRAHGLDVPMVTTDIVDADSAYAAEILRTLASLGIRRYRWGGLRYDDRTPLVKQLEALRPRVARLASLNGRYGVGAMYHTHSGRNQVGASIWDLHELLEGMDPAQVGVNYDVGHATVEGGLGGWIDSFRVTGPYLRGIAVKDFVWTRDGDATWSPHWKPLGEGMVRFAEFLAMVRAATFSGPVQLHFEYPLGGANDGARALSVPDEVVFSAMKRDLRQLRTWLG
jgi:sugar phosphate isomerase/epimerase